MAIGTISTPASWLNGTVAPASWFQNVQDNINGWIAGTGSSLVSLSLNTSASGTTAPTTAVAKGTLFSDTAPLAWALVGSGGTLTRGYNIASVTRNSAGNYSVVVNTAAASTSSMCPIACGDGAGGQFVVTAARQNTTTVAVNITAPSTGTATDCGFMMVLFAA